MNRLHVIALIGSGLLIGCNSQQPPAATQSVVPVAEQPVQAITTLPSPTVKARVPGGYELANNQFRVVISDQTGDVVFWGYADKARNLCYQRGLYATLSALPEAPIKGYVESRDEDTWQFIGSDDQNKIGWRKIYSLQRDVLLVSYMIINNRSEPLDTCIYLNGDLPSLRIMKHSCEEFDAFGGWGVVTMQGWNVKHDPTSQPVLPTLLQSDMFHLKPGERQSYTTGWSISQ